MEALVYHGAGKRAWEEKPNPRILDPKDVILKMSKTTICGTDLHIMKGDVPTVTDGRILGHEGTGIVEEAGPAVSNFKVGEKVMLSCITACGTCSACKKGMYSHCENGGWILGNTIDGTQAEYVRIPYADTSLYHFPPNVDEEALVMVSDILPTGFECGVINGQVQPGDVIAIVGSGPIGLSALLTSQFFSPSEIIMIDMDENRLKIAKTFGATKVVGKNAVEEVMKLTGGRGVDVAIEAVGIPATFDICQSIIAPGGHIANIGVHGKSVELHLEKLWSHNITLRTRLVDTVTAPMLLKTVASGKLQPEKLITHHFQLCDVMQAYDTFGNAAKENALKVLLTNE
ncbi:MAG: zinc-dependent alcohol dehydrogenase family protein [Ignavibacteria bacterium]|jgi:alcohol dehydrogenase|nr:zinc-dependent alcohol dehydrogenase family protein [Ignavibacteria bacterium]MCU7504930.1 zinc-dependent alcohol dehydrogenase family protein [Ignavibacteria bacterium]MCU7518411.1 zinc-dependent alcohol dehydrogenase family protein [Ignavibacteria bacterium]